MIRRLAKRTLTQKQDRRYAAELAARQVSYDAWIRERESALGEQPGTFPEGDSEFIYLIASRGRMSSGCRRACARYFGEHPGCQLAYGDEDVETPGQERISPWFKPAWSPDLLDTYPYFGSVVCLRKSLWERMEEVWGPLLVSAVGEEKGNILCVSPQELDRYGQWLSFCAGLAGAYTQGSEAVGHIGEILFHCEDREQQEKFLRLSQVKERLREEILRDFRDGYLVSQGGEEGAPDRSAVISVIILSRDHPELLRQCLEGCMLAGAGELPCEIVVVDNGSVKDNRLRAETLTRNMSSAQCPIRYVYQPMGFNFSYLCNLGAARSEGHFLLFLNDDVILGRESGLLMMAALADRDHTGAVGLKLYYPDSRRIQHAGITNLPMGPVHKLQFLEDTGDFYFGAGRGFQNVLSVTAACLMIEREKFIAAGGFAPALGVAFNDVDLCFSLYERGYHNVCVNDCFAYHHESMSRGDDESPEKLGRLLAERELLYKRHPALESADPYYPEGLGREGLDTRIRPAYETAGNAVQQLLERLETRKLDAYRRDDCLMLRVEQCREGAVLGYGVVLGDNNSCYEYELLLAADEERAGGRGEGVAGRHEDGEDGSGPKEAYALSLKGQYRPDLAENMPDQVNVGLCGFHVRLTRDNLPPGQYFIGMAARNRVTGLKLKNFSIRRLKI